MYNIPSDNEVECNMIVLFDKASFAEERWRDS